jgi:1,6-anhydro-N-acetylmuramate kinase
VPLVPVYHRALAERLDRPHPVAVLNIGGVANVTFIDGISDPYACDTGPGNALIDDFMRVRKGESRDENGGAASRGLVDEAAVARVLKHSFLRVDHDRRARADDRRGRGGAAVGTTTGDPRVARSFASEHVTVTVLDPHTLAEHAHFYEHEKARVPPVIGLCSREMRPRLTCIFLQNYAAFRFVLPRPIRRCIRRG